MVIHVWKWAYLSQKSSHFHSVKMFEGKIALYHGGWFYWWKIRYLFNICFVMLVRCFVLLGKWLSSNYQAKTKHVNLMSSKDQATGGQHHVSGNGDCLLSPMSVILLSLSNMFSQTSEVVWIGIPLIYTCKLCILYL